MLRWFRTELKILARGTLALAGLLWLIAAGAPCVMAQTPDPVPAPSYCPEHAKHKSIGHSAMPECGPAAAINCQLPDTGTPLASGFGDFAMTPLLLATLPVPAFLPDTGQRPRRDFLNPDIPTPPLHIRYLTLLI